MNQGTIATPTYFHREHDVRTAELSDACNVASRLFTPHRVEYTGRSRHLDARLSASRIGGGTVGDLSYGADVELVNTSALDNYHINVPLFGHAESWCGTESVLGTPLRAAVFLPGRPAGIKWAADCAQLCVKFSRADLEVEIEGLLGRPITKPLAVATSMDLTTETSKSWLGVLSLLRQEFARSESIAQHPLTGRHLEQLVMHGFLLAQPAFREAALGDRGQTLRPRTVRRAIDLLRSHPEKPWTVTDLAREVGIGVRALQEAFKQHLGMPPVAYLREIRLCRVHAELTAASPDTVTVTQIASKWGFGHLGHFGVAYRQKFGVTPNQTLRNAPAS